MPQLIGREVGPIGYGLMGLTAPLYRPKVTPEEQAFAAMKAALAAGCNFWNGGEFYGTPDYNSLHLLNKYFTKYPEDADKVVLSIKGALNMQKHAIDGSPEFIDKSVGNCVRILDGKKKIDIFECARVDKDVPIEVSLQALEKHVKAGNIGAIGLSEASAATIRKAAKVTKIAAVEVELSLFSLDIFSNDIAKACAENNIPIAAYSPIGRGMLSGDIKGPQDIPDGDWRKNNPRFSEENIENNLVLVRQVKEIADAKGVTAAQLAIAWVKQLSKKDGNPEIIPIPGATTVERVRENAEEVVLSSSELAKIDAVLNKFKVAGTRYDENGMKSIGH